MLFYGRSWFVLGNVIFFKGIEVNKAKINVMRGLSPPTTVRKVSSFLGRVGFTGDSSKAFQRLQDFYAHCNRNISYLSLIRSAKKLLRS